MYNQINGGRSLNHLEKCNSRLAKESKNRRQNRIWGLGTLDRDFRETAERQKLRSPTLLRGTQRKGLSIGAS